MASPIAPNPTMPGSTITPGKSPTPTPAQPDSMIVSYLSFRKIIGWMGLTLVPVLIIGSLILDNPKQIDVSVSAYYYSGMRNVLVGVICGIGLFLIAYHGYDRRDSLASKLAGAFCICIALFPTSQQSAKTDLSSKLHYITAGCFFVILSYISIALFTKSTAPIPTPQKLKRNMVYRTCGIVMLVAATCIPLDDIPAIHEKIIAFKPTLIFEAIALMSFGFSWLTKGEFLLKDDPSALTT